MTDEERERRRAATRLQIGDVVAGRYRVEAPIGRGGMGAVYRVRDEALDEDVALKVLDAAHKDALARFRREVKVARKVTHENVARLFDLGADGPRWYLTMELVEGRTAKAALLARRRLPWRAALRIAREVARGLGAAHAQGVVHRDVKPSNVLLADDGRVVVIDFGIARAVDDDGLRTRGAVGTMDYMAPEQVEGREPTTASDVFGLGVSTYQLLTGALPYAGKTALDRALARTTDDAAPLPRDGFPPLLVDLVARMLRREPRARPTMPEVERAAQRILAGAPDEGADTAASPRAPRNTTVADELSDEARAAVHRARRLARVPVAGRSEEAAALLEHALAEQPTHAGALALRALVVARGWDFPGSPFADDKGAMVRDAVARALADAPDEPETHVAAAVVAVQDMRFPDARRALDHALALDPSHAVAHEHYGRIECEASRADQGVKRLRLATDLDPSTASGLCDAAAVHAKRGDLDEMEALLDEARSHLGEDLLEAFVVEVRVADWLNDAARAKAVLRRLPDDGPPVGRTYVELHARLVAGEDAMRPLQALMDAALEAQGSPRFQVLAHQFSVEIYARRDPARALASLEACARGPFLDVEWLDRCPALEGLRREPRFTAAATRIRAHAASIWS